MPVGEEQPGDVGPDDHEGAVCQVDDVEDAPDQAEAQSDRDVDPTQQEAKDDLLDELAHEAVRASVLARAPGRRRILRRAVGGAGGKDGVVRAILDLLNDHRLIDVEAATIELDLPE